jgi:hypothetical protein
MHVDDEELTAVSLFPDSIGGWTAADPPGESFVIPDGRSIVKVTACRGRW